MKLIQNVLTLVPLVVPALANLYPTQFKNVTWNQDAWELSTTSISMSDYHHQGQVANGYIGLSTAPNGPFYTAFEESSGWPLFDQRITFATVAGFWDSQPRTNGTNFPWLYQYGWDSAISGIPNWAPVVIELEGGEFLDATVNMSTISNVRVARNFRRGLTTWDYTWTPQTAGGSHLNVTYTVFAHKRYINRAIVRLEVIPSHDLNVTVAGVLDGRSALRTDSYATGVDGNMVWTKVKPNGVPQVSAYVYSALKGTPAQHTKRSGQLSGKPYISTNGSTIAQAINVSLRADMKTAVTKYVGVASSDAFQGDAQNMAKDAVIKGMKMGYDQSLIEHEAEWAIAMTPDYVSDYTDPETGALPNNEYLVSLAITSIAGTANLLMNTVGADAIAEVKNAPINKHGISVCGLTSDCYAGQIFWDEETWMQPSLAAIFPDVAHQIANYRVDHYKQAIQNVKTAYQSSKNGTHFSSDAAVFPWTSGRAGNCTGTGPCWDYEYHINGDIVQSFINLWASSGDDAYFGSELMPIVNSLATFYSEILTKNETGYHLTNMTDPDEYANAVDDGGYTMPLIASTLTEANNLREHFGMGRNTTWDGQVGHIFVPRTAEGNILEYDSMNGSISVKQADVILDAFPLDWTVNYTQADKLLDLDYYAAKQSPNGPGMTYAMFSIDASAVSPSGCSAYTYNVYSSYPYVRAPWFGFSEQLDDVYATNGGTNPAFPFLTGHGGALQVNIFGHLGLRYSTNFTLTVDPTLPPQIPHLSYPVFHHHGWPIKAVANSSHTTLTRLTVPRNTANATFTNAPITVIIGTTGVEHLLAPNSSITLANRPQGSIATTPGNLVQCTTVTSLQPFVPGQFPFAAADGANSTVWQPLNASVPSSVTITMPGGFTPITALHFNWGAIPPVNATVVFHNASQAQPSDAVIKLAPVVISKPYSAAEANLVQRYQGNTTDLALNGSQWSGKFVTLTIEGNQEDSAKNATGGTVAEFVVL